MSQVYTVNLMEENVLRGNAAIVKCHIPSFVTEYVTVTSWIISEKTLVDIEIKSDETTDLGIYIKTNLFTHITLAILFPVVMLTFI